MGNKTRTTPCIICGKPVRQDKSTSRDRDTCNRKKAMEKSECEKEKNRRYQRKYRKSDLVKEKAQDKSVALSSVEHLAKHKAKKYKRRCLKCGNKFTGVGAFNRICNECTIVNSKTKPLIGG